MPKVRTWWRRKKVYHRDAVILAALSSALLLASQEPVQASLYEQFLQPVVDQPLLFVVNAILVALAFTSYFAGILVLVGGINFLWGRVGRGRFLVSLGIGLTALVLLKQIAFSILTTGSPAAIILYFTTSLVGIGLIIGFASYALMHEYALMLKRHAKSKWREWRGIRRPSRRRVRSYANGR